jgi:hypothetical protein
MNMNAKHLPHAAANTGIVVILTYI